MEELLKFAARIMFIIFLLYCFVGIWAGFDQDGVGWIVDKIKSFKRKK